MQASKTVNATKTQLAVFSGILLPIIGIAVGLISNRWLNWSSSVAICISFCVAGILGLAAPRLIKPVYFAWKTFSDFLAKMLTIAILTGCFYGVIVPMGLLLRLLGKNPIQEKDSDSENTSYWERRASKSEKSQYFRQY